MNEAKQNSSSELPVELVSSPSVTEVNLPQLLHDFKNHLSGVKLQAAVLKRSLANNSLEVSEGIAMCEKIMQQVDALTLRIKEVAPAAKSSVKSS